MAAYYANVLALLHAHHEDEDELLWPRLTVEERPSCRDAMRTFAGDRMWLVLGLVQEQMPPAARTRMESAMPPPLRDMWQGSGRAHFEEFVAALRG